MTGNVASFHQNYPPDRKIQNDIVEKDVRKWVESVVEFKANMEKKKSEVQSHENQLKKMKKYKIKKKPSLVSVPITAVKNPTVQRKSLKAKKAVKKSQHPQNSPKTTKKPSSPTIDQFALIKESYRALKLPQNWTSGLSNNRLVFNRIKVTTQNAQQKMTVDRSLVITKDRTVHVLVNGTEVTLTNWEMPKVETVEDIKRAIKEFDAMKISDGSHIGVKTPQCNALMDSKLKLCQACKSEGTNPPKPPAKKPKKKASEPKGAQKEKPLQSQ